MTSTIPHPRLTGHGQLTQRVLGTSILGFGVFTILHIYAAVCNIPTYASGTPPPPTMDSTSPHTDWSVLWKQTQPRQANLTKTTLLTCRYCRHAAPTPEVLKQNSTEGLQLMCQHTKQLQSQPPAHGTWIVTEGSMRAGLHHEDHTAHLAPVCGTPALKMYSCR